MSRVSWLPEDTFVAAIKALPLVSVDWVVVDPQNRFLLGLRRNAPARQWWFTPGGRVQKNEPMASALRRVAETELGLSWEEAHAAQLMGVWDHFYEDSAFSSEVSTHYVNLPHFLRLSRTLNLSDLPLDQHLDWRWQDAGSAAMAEDVHPYVRVYAQWVVQQQ